jgi:ABC-type sugar transport systems, permease components
MKMPKITSITSNKVNLLVLPAIIIVAIITQIPFVVTIFLSLIKWIVVRPDLGIRFTGFDNYIKIFTSETFYITIFNTFLITLISILLCTVLSIAMSVLLDRRIPGINIVRTLMIAPFFVMDAVTGIVWKTLILHPSFGFNGYFAGLLHVKPIDFLGVFSILTVIILIVWQWTPFFIMIILAGLQGISEEIIESAKIDGANGFETLMFVKLPSIINHIEVAVMLGVIFILKVFGVIYVTTFGGPGYSSTNLPFYVYKVGFFGWDVGKATAIATIMVFLTLAAVMSLFKFIRSRFAIMR